MKPILHLVLVKISLLSILLSSLAAAAADHFVFLIAVSILQFFNIVRKGGQTNVKKELQNS